MPPNAARLLLSATCAVPRARRTQGTPAAGIEYLQRPKCLDRLALSCCFPARRSVICSANWLGLYTNNVCTLRVGGLPRHHITGRPPSFASISPFYPTRIYIHTVHLAQQHFIARLSDRLSLSLSSSSSYFSLSYFFFFFFIFFFIFLLLILHLTYIPFIIILYLSTVLRPSFPPFLFFYIRLAPILIALQLLLPPS